MVRRIATFIVLIALIGAVALLMYFNGQETSFRLTKDMSLTLPLGGLMMLAAIAGALFMFLLALMREGRHALRDWSVHREVRGAKRNAQHIVEARSLTLAGDYKRARTLLTRATQKSSPEIGDVIDYAETFLLDNDPVQARTILEEGQKDFGNEPLLLFALAKACRATGDAPAAVSALERAVSVYPRSTALLTMLRDVLFESESWTRAEEIQRRIVELNPDDASEKNWLLGARYEAASAASEGARDEALRDIAGDDPDFLPALIDRAVIAADAGDWWRAFKILEKSVKRRPHAVVLDTLEKIVPTEDAPRLSRIYSKLVASNPDDGVLKLRAAHYLIGHGRVEEAAEMLGPPPDNGSDPAALALWGAIHDAREESTLAHGSYRGALEGSASTGGGFACGVCATPAAQWQSRCDSCGAWGTLESAA